MWGSEAWGSDAWGSSAPGAGSTTITLGRATETDTARSVAHSATIELGVAVETDVCIGITVLVRVTLGRAVESDVAEFVNTARELGIATETDTARALVVSRHFTLGRATESDLARAMPMGLHLILGRATESDSARALSAVDAAVVAGSSQLVRVHFLPGYPSQPADLVVIAMDKVIRRAPSSLAVSVSGAESDEALTFKIDDTIVDTGDANSDGTLQQISIPIPDTFMGGVHTVTVVTAGGRQGSDTFTLQFDPSVADVIQGADTSPVTIPAAEIIPDVFYKWVFQDLMPDGLGSWVMPINPSAMTSPGFLTNVEVQHSTAVVSGQFHIWEHGRTATPWSFSGFCPDQDFYDQLRAYAAITRRFYIIDHRNRAWKVAITGVDMVLRKRYLDEHGAPLDWLGDYTINAVIYDQNPSVPV